MPNALRVAVLSDTHVAPGRTLPDEVWAELATAQAILHAGDVVSAQLLDELAAVAPVHAVLGNNDTGLGGALPERLQVDLAGVAVALVHDSGARAGRPARLRRWFPHADLVVFGHSHEPVDEVGQDGQRLFNPGSPTQRRRQPRRTMGWLELADGAVVSHAVVPVGPPP
jgi:putative phosphoesterase